VAVVARDGSVLTHVPLLVNPLVTVRANHAAHNAALGIRSVADVADGGGNRAHHNGDPRQCLGVSCH
jgi:hypothetical protein